MIRDTTSLMIGPASAAPLNAALLRAVPPFMSARSGHGLHPARAIERPVQGRLAVAGQTVKAHAEGFRKARVFQRSRVLAGRRFPPLPPVIRTRQVTMP